MSKREEKKESFKLFFLLLFELRVCVNQKKKEEEREKREKIKLEIREREREREFLKLVQPEGVIGGRKRSEKEKEREKNKT